MKTETEDIGELNPSRPSFTWSPITRALGVLICAGMLGCAPEESHDHAHDHNHGEHVDHAHQHIAPHGGAAVVLGDELYHLEFVLDAQTASLDCYVLDGHMEQFLRIENDHIELEIEDGERLKLLPIASRATGESVGDTSHFRAELEWPKGKINFEATVKEITINGNRFENIPFRYPEGNETN